VPAILPDWLDNHPRLRDALARLRLCWPPTEDRLRTCYRRRSLESHPDHGGDHESFVALQDARDVVEAALRDGLPSPHEDLPDADPADGSWDGGGGWGYEETAFERFRDGFKRSRKGNLWRLWDGRTITVFQRRDGRFGWCISDHAGQRWSPWQGWADEQSALEGLWRELDPGFEDDGVDDPAG
jgi:hypothetical protein